MKHRREVMNTQSTFTRFATLTLLLTLPLSAVGGELFQLTAHSQEQVMGRTISVPAVSRNICMPAKKLDPHRLMANKRGSDCKVDDYNDKGDVVTYSVSCTKPEKVESTGTFHRHPDSGFDGKIQNTLVAQGMTVHVITKYTGKPIGHCNYKPIAY
jgi:hypothetical protein